MFIPIYQTKRLHVLEYRTLNNYHSENFKSLTVQLGLAGRWLCNRCNWIIGTNQYKLHQKFSGCGACSAVVEYFEPTDSHNDTRVENRFKTLKHKGGGTNALTARHDPRGLDVLEATRGTERFPSTFDPEKAFTNFRLTTWQRVQSNWTDGVGQTNTKKTGTVRIVWQQ
jgi:hypothetical protein